FVSPTHTTMRLNDESTDIFGWMAGSGKACIAHGMAAWELTYLGIPTHAFSATPLHLRFAEGMARRGLIKAWPTVGLPSNKEIKAFLSEPFEPDVRNVP